MSDVFLLPNMDLTPVFAQTQGQKEYSLENQVLQRGLFNGFKWSLCQLVQHLGEIPRGDAPLTLRSVSMETIDEPSEILIFPNIYGRSIDPKTKACLATLGQSK